MKYVLLFVDTEEFSQRLEELPGTELQRLRDDVYDWFSRHADRITNRGNKLQGAESATTVRLDGAGGALVTDGPFVEGKEVISGYVEIDVADLDAALRMVKEWPGCPTVEIRPVADIPG